MFALPLDDPLWQKLDDAHRQRDIPATLAMLAKSWDAEVVTEIFWDDLCHQDTCYGATYAVVPHLLKIASAKAEATDDIAFFLGHVASVAFQPDNGCGRSETGLLQGLPDTLEAWDRKLDCYRDLADYARRDLADPNFPPKVDDANWGDTVVLLKKHLPNMPDIPEPEPIPALTREFRQDELDRYLDLLNRPPVDEDDLMTITQIRAAFLEALGPIAELSASVYLADRSEESRHYLLAGVAAGLQAPRLAELFGGGSDGYFQCANCGWDHSYLFFDDRMACYASPVGPGQDRVVFSKDPSTSDNQEGAPSRADGFVAPSGKSGDSPAAKRIAELVGDLGIDAETIRLKAFLGTFHCNKCGSDCALY